MNPQFYKVMVFTLWFLLPMLPAFILYRFLPSKSLVTGPFKGMKLDLAGAFAGYFLLFLGAYLVVRQMIFEKSDEYEVWRVSIDVRDDRNNPLTRDKHRSSVSFFPAYEINNGSFEAPIVVKVKDDYYDFPGINIAASRLDDAMPLFISNDYMPDLSKPDTRKGESHANWSYDFKRKIITYNKPIILSAEQKSPAIVADNTHNIVDVELADSSAVR